MKGAMQSTLEGGFLVPKLNADGLIMGYGVERVLSTFNYPDGSTFYTCADGSSLVRNSLSTGESLESASAGRHDVWKLWNPTQPNSRVVIYGDGTYSNKFWDAEGHLVTQTNITGSNGTFKINADSSDGRYSLITVTGERNSTCEHLGGLTELIHRALHHRQLCSRLRSGEIDSLVLK